MMPLVKYYGWSALSLETDAGALFFDPFFRRYCGAQWFALEDFLHAKVVCVTHGHEEHYLDTPEVVARSGATVVATKTVCDYLHRRSAVPRDRLVPVTAFAPQRLPGFTITAFHWQHRDINLWKAIPMAVLHGNTTQLAWAWSSATKAPFWSAYTGFHVELPNGLTVLNYNEGFNPKMTDAEIEDLGRRFRTDVLLAGMQLDFVADVRRGVAALAPKIVVLYPPHEKFHEMMGVSAAPWEAFAAAVRERLPEARVVVAYPGTAVDLATGAATASPPRLKVA
jgi:L-ascorbate metabolism protein UlaG (beta-lactamase superfamily)